MKIKGIEVRPANFLLQNTFRTSLGQKNVTKNVIVRVECEDGIQGWGEASSSLAMPEATQALMTATLRACEPIARNRELNGWEEISKDARGKFKNHPTAISALECALLDAYCRSKKWPLNRFFGSKTKPIQTTYTLSALNIRDSNKIVMRKTREGFHQFKIKVMGKSVDEDFKRIQLCVKFCGREKLIVDANQAWDPETAVRFIERLNRARLPIAVIEQPVQRTDINGMVFVKKRSPYPVAADESVRSFEDARNIIDRGAADIINIKIAKLGLLEAIKIATAAQKSNLKLMVGCMMESVVGLATSVFWAIGSGIFSHVDLDSFLLLRPNKYRSGFLNKGPEIFMRDRFLGSGTGVQ